MTLTLTISFAILVVLGIAEFFLPGRRAPKDRKIDALIAKNQFRYGPRIVAPGGVIGSYRDVDHVAINRAGNAIWYQVAAAQVRIKAVMK